MAKVSYRVASLGPKQEQNPAVSVSQYCLLFLALLTIHHQPSRLRLKCLINVRGKRSESGRKHIRRHAIVAPMLLYTATSHDME